MTNIEFKKLLEKCVNERGFKHSKKNYYFYSESLIIVINIQKSNYDDGYYINYGFFVKAIHGDNFVYPKISECDITGRFLNDIGGKKEFIFSSSSISSHECVEAINGNIEKIIVPVIEQGIKKYFEMFPNAICAAKLNLKEYLKKG